MGRGASRSAREWPSVALGLGGQAAAQGVDAADRGDLAHPIAAADRRELDPDRRLAGERELPVQSTEEILAEAERIDTEEDERFGERRGGDRLLRELFGQNKGAIFKSRRVEGANEVGLASGFRGRILWNYLAPRTILNM